MINIAYNIDCMEYMKTVPDGYFDLCVCDPPYGLSITARHPEHTHTARAAIVGGGGRPFGGKKGTSVWKKQKSLGISKFYPVFDDSSPPDERAFRELFRIAKNVIIWGGNFFLSYLGPASCMIVWDKKRRGLDQADCEIAWTNLKQQSRIFEYKWNGMLQENMKNKQIRIHATEKPFALYTYCYQLCGLKPGDKVFDGYLGSGSSRIAAYDMGLDFIGCEIDKTIFDLQEQRFADYTAQESLFANDYEQMTI